METENKMDWMKHFANTPRKGGAAIGHFWALGPKVTLEESGIETPPWDWGVVLPDDKFSVLLTEELRASGEVFRRTVTVWPFSGKMSESMVLINV